MTTHPKVQAAVDYVHERRGRFSALGTALVMLPLMKRPRDIWSEFEKDFRMYDEQHKRKSSK